MKLYCQDYTKENILSSKYKENVMNNDLSFFDARNEKSHPNPYRC